MEENNNGGKEQPRRINLPANYYIEAVLCAAMILFWIPAFAGMTKDGVKWK